MAGIAAAVLGAVADAKGIDYVYFFCSFLPLLGLLTIFLPDMKGLHPPPAKSVEA
jgi:FSR family fosmidomycin resistance protein-like MFS transporter